MARLKKCVSINKYSRKKGNVRNDHEKLKRSGLDFTRFYLLLAVPSYTYSRLSMLASAKIWPKMLASSKTTIFGIFTHHSQV